MIRLIAEMLGVPYTFISATSLVQTGYVVTRIENLVGEMYLRSGKDRYMTERSIVFIDEIDKVAAHKGSDGPDISSAGAQQALLSILDGCVVSASTGGSSEHILSDIDTSGILFVCAGAFVDLEKITRLRRTNSIGFLASRRGGAAGGWSKQDLPRTGELVEFGFIPEFIGRFSTLTAVRKLTVEDLVSILRHAEESILPKQQRLFELHGIDLEFMDEALCAVAEEADGLGTGARALPRIVVRSLDDVDYRLPELADDGVTMVTVTAGAVLGREAAVLIREPRGQDAAPCPVPLACEIRAAVLRRQPDLVCDSITARNGITDTAGMSDESIRKLVVAAKATIGLEEAGTSAREWWEAFEAEYQQKISQVLRLAEELQVRKATITDFFYARAQADSVSVVCVLHYLDYMLCKKAWENDRRG